VSQVRAIGAREALGGPWAFNLTGWLVLFFPCTILVVLQESATPYPHIGFVMVSAAAQHLAAGVVSLSAAIPLRRNGRLLPVWSSFTIWSGIGIVRGLVGGAMASAFAGADGDFALRITVWLLVSWVWMPLFAYTAAQGQHRRALLNALDDAVDRRDSARRMRERSGDDIRAQLVAAIQTAVTRVIEDIQFGLSATQASLDADQLRLLGDRLASVTRQVGSVVGHLTKPTAETPRLGARTGAPLISAFTFERRKPWLSSALSAAALIAVLAPLCMNVKGGPFLFDFGLAMIAATLMLVLGSRIVPSGLDRFYRQVAWLVTRYGAAGLCGAVVLTVLRWDDLDWFTTLCILMLPGAIAFAAMIVSGAVGLAAANRRAVRSFSAIELERTEMELAAAREENVIRDQLAQVMHGPILGRLAACAMALNFHAAEVGSVPAERTEHVVRSVAEHLDAATADLDSLVH
jgi:hypothetical protein